MNLLSDPMLLALLASALCPEEHPGEAELLARRLEHLRLDETAVLGELSPLKAGIAIELAKLEAIETDERRARADLRLFEARHPAPAKAPRRNETDALELERRRSELRQALEFAEDDLKAQQARLEQQQSRSEKYAERQAALAAERLEIEHGLRGAAALNVLDQLSRGASRRALGFLTELRRLLRGSTSVAVLSVICELLAPSIENGEPHKGPAQARAALLEFRALFAQSGDPLPRVLEALIALREGKQPRALDPGVFQPADFRQLAHWRLYQLIGVLCGQSFESAKGAVEAWPGEHGQESWKELLLLLELLPLPGQAPSAQCLAWLERAGASPAHSEQPGAASLSDPALGAGKAHSLNLLLRGQLLLSLNQNELIPHAFGISLPQEGKPLRRGLALLLPGGKGKALEHEWPRLADLLESRLAALHLPLLQPIMVSTLCCMLLLAAKASGPEELYQAWLAESYGWPKQDFYWWTLAQLTDDSQLLKNCSQSRNELFSVPASSARRA